MILYTDTNTHAHTHTQEENDPGFTPVLLQPEMYTPHQQVRLPTISTSDTGPKLVTKMSVFTSVTGPAVQ